MGRERASTWSARRRARGGRRPGPARRAGAVTLEGAVYREPGEIVARRREALRGYPRWWRQAGGYRLDRVLGEDGTLDPAKVVAGSEGTLAIVVEAEVALDPVPGVRVMAVGHFGSTAA